MRGAEEPFNELSVVIPAYNAEGQVCATLDAVQSYLQGRGLKHELIVVDDGSSDETARRVQRWGGQVKLLRNGGNRGKGHAVRRGMLASRYAWTLFMDVDNSTSIEHLERFAPRAPDADVLIASRNLDGSRIVGGRPLLRHFLGQTFPHAVRLLALRGIRDTQCGFKAFRRQALREIFPRQRSEGFCFDVEVLLIARRLGYRIAEIPIDWDNPPESTLRLWRDAPGMLADLARITWRHRPARYCSPAELQQQTDRS